MSKKFVNNSNEHHIQNHCIKPGKLQVGKKPKISIPNSKKSSKNDNVKHLH